MSLSNERSHITVAWLKLAARCRMRSAQADPERPIDPLKPEVRF